jgi:hypothetical protein
MAFYQLYEWQVVPGKMEDMLKLEKPFQAYIRSIGGKPIGGFTTGIGDSTHLLALIAYEDFGRLGQAIQAAQQNADLQRLVQAASGFYTDSKTSILLPTPESQLQ